MGSRCVADTLQITRPRRTKHLRRLRHGHPNKDSRYVPVGGTHIRDAKISTSPIVWHVRSACPAQNARLPEREATLAVSRSGGRSRVSVGRCIRASRTRVRGRNRRSASRRGRRQAVATSQRSRYAVAVSFRRLEGGDSGHRGSRRSTSAASVAERPLVENRHQPYDCIGAVSTGGSDLD